MWAEIPPTTFYSELQAAQKVAKILYLNNISIINTIKNIKDILEISIFVMIFITIPVTNSCLF